VVQFVDPAQQKPLDGRAEDPREQGRQQQHRPVVDPEVVQAHPGEHRAQHEEGTVGEVDDVQHPEDDREAQTQDGVEGAVDQAQQQLAEQHRQGNVEHLHG
jgi:hypothetical protein